MSFDFRCSRRSIRKYQSSLRVGSIVFRMVTRRNKGKRKEVAQESGAQNIGGNDGVPRGRRGRPAGEADQKADTEVEQLAHRVDEMELAVARFQNMRPAKFFGNEGSDRAEGWLKHMEFLFNTVHYDSDRRLTMAVLQLRDRAQRWWEATTNVMKQTCNQITWEVFRTKFIQEYSPPSYYSARESEFHRLVQGNMSVEEYVRQLSALLTYVPHVAVSEKGKISKFLEGLNYHLHAMVTAGSPTTYAEAVDKAIGIEAGLRRGGQPQTPQIPSGGSYFSASLSRAQGQMQPQQFLMPEVVLRVAHLNATLLLHCHTSSLVTHRSGVMCHSLFRVPSRPEFMR